jgi:predicted LPLAT superfamily acyltransferase
MDRTAQRKVKKSYTLATESVAFLEQLRKRRRAASVSSVLDEIVQSFRRGQRRKMVEEAIAEYYNSLDPAELHEQVQWGEFALNEFPKNSR